MNYSSAFNIIIDKFNVLLIITYLVLVPLLFSSVSIIAKIILLLLLILILINSIYLYHKKEFLITEFTSQLFIIILSFLVYLYANTYFFSKIIFESKIELINIFLYILTFCIFYFVSKNKKLTAELKLSFFIVQFFILLLYLIYKEKIVYFLLYNPNILGGYCLLSLLFSVGWIYENKKVDIFCGINLVLSTVLLLVVKNFSSWFVVIMFLLVICIKNFFVLVFVLCSLIITGVVVNPVSFFDRLTWFTIGWRMWNDNFLFGVGLGNFKWFYPQYVINVPFLPSMGTIFAHNYFIQMSAETGVVWLMLFFLMIYLVLRSSLVLKDVKGINKRYFLPLCGILLQNTVDYNLLIPQNNILFFIFLSLLISDIENIENRKFQQLKMNKNLYFLLIIFLCSYSVLVSIKMEKIVRLLTTGSETNMMKVITEDKTCWYGYKQLGLFALQKGEIKKAQKMLLKTIQNNPVEAESHFYLSMINFKLGDKKVAYKFLSNAVKLNPRNADKYVKLFQKGQKLK